VPTKPDLGTKVAVSESRPITQCDRLKLAHPPNPSFKACASRCKRLIIRQTSVLLHFAAMPPSTVNTAPVMNAAADEHRNSTAFAMSSGVPGRPNGTWA
jgi:hypothetical protein